MRIPSLVKRRTLGFFALAASTAALAACAAGVFDGAVRPLSSAEMQGTLGLQGENYICFQDAGCCQGLQCGMCPDCYECTNDGPSIGVCQESSGMYCTVLPAHDCGDVVQGECYCGGTLCDMSNPVVVGSCGTIAQCQ